MRRPYSEAELEFNPCRIAAMRGRERVGVAVSVRLLGVAALAGMLMLAVASPTVAKKRKKVQAAVTTTSSTPLAPGAQTSATANCPNKTHVTGGGWSLAPTFSANGSNAPADGTGARITQLQSQPNGLTRWTAGAAAFNLPPTGGTFTSIARCESKGLGRTLLGVSGTSTVPIGQESTIGLRCSTGTHVLSGGFSLSPPGNLADPVGFRAHVVESRRRDAGTWEIDVVNPNGAPGEATISAQALCELNAKGTAVTETSATAPIADNGRTTAVASCTGKTHSIGGGFLVSPTVGPAVSIDQMQPIGAKGWQVGLYEYPGFNLPAGSTVAAYSYCKKNALPRKKKRR
jgi:hypothetical protein